MHRPRDQFPIGSICHLLEEFILDRLGNEGYVTVSEGELASARVMSAKTSHEEVTLVDRGQRGRGHLAPSRPILIDLGTRISER